MEKLKLGVQVRKGKRDKQSRTLACECGIAQGSVLGTLIYTLYVTPIAGVIASFHVSHMQCADDTQL